MRGRVGWRRGQVVAPRFQGPLAGAVASHPLLQMHQWDPTRSTDRLLALLRHFMEVRPCFGTWTVIESYHINMFF